MENYKDFFKGKKVTQMSLGVLGRAVGDAKFMAEHGVDLIVTDLKTEKELEESLLQLKGFSNITFHLGGHSMEDFKNRDFILKGAGIPFDSPYIAEARTNGVPVEMSTSLFAKLTEATIIGITGTRGKSTVTHLLYEILKKGYKKGNVFIGGNVKGVSTLALLPETKAGDLVVMELDSWQLQGFGDSKISPHVSVFTTFLADHLNYYKGDKGAYLNDKANIFRYQKPGDALILGAQAAPIVNEKYPGIRSHVSIVDGSALPHGWKLQIPGEHNRYNGALAAEAARTLGVPENIIREAIESFKGVPGRLEFVGERNGVMFYNDTTATTPDATLAALEALKEHIVLIFGGADKNLDMTRLFDVVPKRVKQIVLLPGTGTERIKNDLAKTGIAVREAVGMKEAVQKASEAAIPGDTVLLSPGFASFGIFKNEFDRGEQFNEAVRNLSTEVV